MGLVWEGSTTVDEVPLAFRGIENKKVNKELRTS